MYCPKCKSYVTAYDVICPNCGKTLGDDTQKFAYDLEYAQRTSMASQIYTYGLIGIIFTLFTFIPGLVFSILALSKAKAYRNIFQELDGKAAKGRFYAMIALIICIAYLVITVLIITIAILISIAY